MRDRSPEGVTGARESMTAEHDLRRLLAGRRLTFGPGPARLGAARRLVRDGRLKTEMVRDERLKMGVRRSGWGRGLN